MPAAEATPTATVSVTVRTLHAQWL